MDDSSFHIARPYWLLVGPLLAAALAMVMLRSDRLRESALARLVHPRFRAKLVPGHSSKLVWTRRALWLTGVLLLCVAAAGPRFGFEWREVKRRGIDILFAVDTSRSMLAEDLSPNRLERARLGIQDFVDHLNGDRVGLIPFAGSSYALCPLTLDYDAFRESLKALDTDLIPRQGTDVASAIREASRLFDQQKGNHRILVLITDGEDLQGDALEAARTAAKEGMVIYPIGVGSTEGQTIPLRLPNGQVDVLRDASGAVVRTKLDEAALQKIAEITNGLYAPLGRKAEGLDTIYQEKLRLVPRNEMDAKAEKVPLERYQWPLGIALVLLLIEFLLPERRRAAADVRLPSAGRRRALPAASPLLVALGCLFAAGTPHSRAEDMRVLYNQGTAEYDKGDFAKAAATLRASLNGADLKLQNRIYYNLGNALYRQGAAALEKSPAETEKSWKESIKAYSDALALDHSDEDAQFNKDLVQRKLDSLKNKDNKKDDEKKDQKDDEKDGDKKDGDKKDGDKKDGDKKDGEQKDGEQKEQDKNSDGTGKKSAEDQPSDEGKPGEEKQPGQADDASKKDDKAADPSGEKKQDEEIGKEKEASKTEKGSDAKAPGEDGKEKATGEEKTGEKQEGKEGKGGEESEGTKEAKEGEPASQVSEERRKVGEMTPEEARQLLMTLRSDERTVIPLEKPPPQRSRRFVDPNNTTKGKTW